jgi:hypothetical protein
MNAYETGLPGASRAESCRESITIADAEDDSPSSLSAILQIVEDSEEGETSESYGFRLLGLHYRTS